MTDTTDMKKLGVAGQRALLRLQTERYPEAARKGTCPVCRFVGWMGGFDLYICKESDFVLATFGDGEDDWADARPHTSRNRNIIDDRTAFIIREEADRRGKVVLGWHKSPAGDWRTDDV